MAFIHTAKIGVLVNLAAFIRPLTEITRWLIVYVIASSCTLVFAMAAFGAPNDLKSSPSPYLRLHATDPVEWRQWNEDALEEARQTNRPIFLSIGYLACHWCHVMQKESFSDSITAEILNSRFIPVLVDRELQPDIDELFQQLAIKLGIQTGWPLNLVLTPDGQPFFGGVYFPPEPRAGILSFRAVLAESEKLYRADPEGVADYAVSAINRLSQEALDASGPHPIARTELKAAISRLAAEVDDFNGGFGDGAKFPRFPALRALWRGYLRSGENALREAVTTNIEAMVSGAIMDHVGGGFFRYTVDPLWRQPHFEKMLDVNAQAILVFTEVWQETRDPNLVRAVEGTVQFLLEELRLPEGAFASALDATSEGKDGAFYVWDADTIRDALGSDHRIFNQAFALAPQETGVPGSALYRLDASVDAIASEAGLTNTELWLRLTGAFGQLKELRSRRSRPRRDDKIVASLNGLAVTALVNAGMAFTRPDWVKMARKAFKSTLDALSNEAGLHHSFYAGQVSGPANLEDRASLARAAIVLFMAEGNPADLDSARAIISSITTFEDTENGGYFVSGQAAATELPRLRIARDSAAPSGNAIVGDVFSSLYYLTGDGRFLEKAERVTKGFSKKAIANPLEHAGILMAADVMHDAIQVVIVAQEGSPDLGRLVSAAWQVNAPGRILQIIAPGTELPDGHPAQYKGRVDNKATAYVCVGQICSLPNTHPDELQRTVVEFRRTWD